MPKTGSENQTVRFKTGASAFFERGPTRSLLHSRYFAVKERNSDSHMPPKKNGPSKSVEAFTYDGASRKNIPTAEYLAAVE